MKLLETYVCGVQMQKALEILKFALNGQLEKEISYLYYDGERYFTVRSEERDKFLQEMSSVPNSSEPLQTSQSDSIRHGTFRYGRDFY